MTKVYELPNGHRLVADFDENGIAKVTVQALDRLVEKLNYYADKCEEYEEKEQSENLMGIIRGDWQVTFE